MWGRGLGVASSLTRSLRRGRTEGSSIISSAGVAAPSTSAGQAPGPVPSPWTVCVRWATKKAGSKTKNSADSAGRRLGVKKFGGAIVRIGHIMIRQRGRKYHPGDGVGIGKDHTIFAMKDGYSHFRYDPLKRRQYVNVLSAADHLALQARLREASATNKKRREVELAARMSVRA